MLNWNALQQALLSLTLKGALARWIPNYLLRCRIPSQTGIRAAARMYRSILNGVRANGYDNLTQRAIVPLRRKVGAALANDYRRRRNGLASRNATIASALGARPEP